MTVELSNGKGPRVYVGTYTESEHSTSEGVYIYRMDPSSGELAFENIIENVINPSYIAVHPRSGWLYAVNESRTFQGIPAGGVSAFSIDSGGKIDSLNQQSSEGEDPCYISIERTGRFALVANYSGGSVAVLPIREDGNLGPASHVVRHSGSSIHPDRQEGPHAHCILPDPDNRFAVAVDLGIDRLMVYRMDLEAGQLHGHGEVKLGEGSGPRHLIFHPHGRFAYVLCELNSTLNAFRYDGGAFEEFQSIRTLPRGFGGRNLCADLHISPDGKYLYASNRGHDSLACFTIDADSGQLTFQDHIPSGGREPRGFTIDPSGKFLLAANQNSNNIVTFLIDSAMGKLSRTEAEVEVPMPVCIKFA